MFGQKPYVRPTSKGRQIFGVLAGVQTPSYQVLQPRQPWQWRVTRFAVRVAARLVRRVMRKTWGRRRILAPWFIAMSVWVSAAVAHLVERGWVTVGVLALSSAPAVWWWLGLPPRRWSRRRGLPTRAQRWWYGGAYAATALWAVVAARWGAGPPRLGYLAVMTLACWVAWCWRHRTRPEKPAELGEVEATWAAVPGMADTTVENVTKAKDPARVQFDVDLSATNLLVAEVVSKAPQVAKRFKVPRENVVADYAPGRLEDRARFEIVWDNPCNQVVLYDKSWIPTEKEIAQGIVPFHLYPNGRRGYARLWYPGAGTTNTLLSGDIGAGKSAGQEALMTQAAWTGRVWLMAGDPQGGASMPAWCGAEGQARWQAPCEPDDLGPIEAQMLFMREAMYNRTDRMRDFKWTDRHGDDRVGLASWDYDITGWPAIGLHVAEFWRVMKEPDLAELAKELLKLMRKAGQYLALDTQYPAIEEFNNDMSLRQPLTAGNIFCYRNTANTVRNMILPSHLPGPDGIPSETPEGEHTKGTLIAASQAPRSSLANYSRSVWAERSTYWAKQASARGPELEPELQKILHKYVSAPAKPREEPQREVVKVSMAKPTGKQTYLDRIVAYLAAAPDRRAHTGVIARDLDIPLPRVSEALARGEKRGIRSVRQGVWALTVQASVENEEVAA